MRMRTTVFHRVLVTGAFVGVKGTVSSAIDIFKEKSNAFLTKLVLRMQTVFMRI